jgi:hypothetical protein
MTSREGKLRRPYCAAAVKIHGVPAAGKPLAPDCARPGGATAAPALAAVRLCPSLGTRIQETKGVYMYVESRHTGQRVPAAGPNAFG